MKSWRPDRLFAMMSRRFGLMCLAAFLSGCATTVEDPSSLLSQQIPGIYHKVQSGETLWRVAKTYGVGMDEILKTNRIPNIAYIEKGQLIFIPGADEVKTVAPAQTALPETRDDGEFIWPVDGRVTQYFGARNGSQKSRGIGIQPMAGAFVKAARRGKVVFSDYLTGYAFTVILDHRDGFYSVYSNNKSLLVKLGEEVGKGHQVAVVGERRRQPYLHFEIRKQGRASNPLYYLPKR